MRATRLAIAAVMLAVTAGDSRAAFISLDFQNANDHLLILDTTSNKEWVITSATRGFTAQQFLTSSIYAGAGFRLAKQSDLEELFTNVGASSINYNTLSFTVANYPASQLLYSIMNHVAPFDPMYHNPWVHGFYDAGQIGLVSVARVGNGDVLNSPGKGTFDILPSWLIAANSNPYGPQLSVWALRDSPAATVTPEPTSLALAGFAGLGMAAGAWRRRRQSAKHQSA